MYHGHRIGLLGGFMCLLHAGYWAAGGSGSGRRGGAGGRGGGSGSSFYQKDSNVVTLTDANFHQQACNASNPNPQARVLVLKPAWCKPHHCKLLQLLEPSPPVLILSTTKPLNHLLFSPFQLFIQGLFLAAVPNREVKSSSSHVYIALLGMPTI